MARVARIVLAGLVVGCGGDSGAESGSFGSDSTTNTVGSTSTTAGTSGTSGESTGETKLDVGFATESSTGTTTEGCQKVDFLFVIDNSGSMRDEQDRLVEAFPGFIDSIRDTVQGMDHHIMVIDSDENPAWLCEEFLNGDHCNGTNQQPDCGNYVCGSIDMLGECDVTLGAGVISPYGGYASNMSCGYPAGRRYLTETDPDLESTFACAAKVGTSGESDERPMTGMVAALGDVLAEPGACNEGFLRDDAILVITFVSDDGASMFSPNDDASAGDPVAWHDGVVAAKNGNEDAIVVIGLVPYGDVSCVFPMEETVRFVQFVESFGDGGVLGSVCEPSYAEVFDGAVSVIDTTCDEFEPEG